MRIVLFSLLMLALAPVPAFAADLRCTGVSGGHLGREALCAAARNALNAVPGAMTLEILRDEPAALSARLIIGGEPGPRVDVTSADRPLDGRAATRLAQGLLRSTLP